MASAALNFRGWSSVPPSRNLNVRDLLNPIFHSRDVNHNDSSRSLERKQRDRNIQAARRLKRQMREA